MTKSTKKIDVTETNQETIKEVETKMSEDSKSIKETLESLAKELAELKEQNKRFTQKEQDAIEAAREEMITDDDEGPCKLDEKYKEAGYHYRAVDTTRPNRVSNMIKKGYEIAYKPGKSGSSSSDLTDALLIDLGNDFKTRQGVWMRCPTEVYNKRQKIKERNNRETLEDQVGVMSSGAAFGEITIGDKTHYKKD